MPGAVAFWLCALLVAGAMTLLALGAVRAAARLGVDWPGGQSRRRAPSSRWARARDLRPLIVRRAQPGRLTLGRYGRSLLAAGERQSVIVVAPTQSHKTTGLAIPALLEWEGPVLATSVKTDLFLDTLAHRESKGRVMIFDPARTTGLPRARVTPLWGARTWRGAMRVAHWLAAAARTGSAAGLQDADFWFAAAEKLLAPLLFAAASEGHSMGAVVRWLDEGAETSEPEVLDILRSAGVEEAERAYLATQNREERQRSSVYTTAEMIVVAFADPEVEAETAGADYSPTALLDGGANTLYLCAPLHEQERLRPLFSMIVQELLAVVYESAASTGRPLAPGAPRRRRRGDRRGRSPRGRRAPRCGLPGSPGLPRPDRGRGRGPRGCGWAAVRRRQRLAWPVASSTSSVTWAGVGLPSIITESSAPVIGRRPRPLATWANSIAPQRPSWSVRAKAG
jgi:type IV secretion system protein VirD4